MAFFVNPGKDWENNLTEEDIAKLEAQACDVSRLRKHTAVPGRLLRRNSFRIPTPAWRDPRSLICKHPGIWQFLLQGMQATPPGRSRIAAKEDAALC